MSPNVRHSTAPGLSLPHCPADRVADLKLGDRPRPAIGHQYLRVAGKAVDAGVAAATVGVDRPSKRHLRCLRNVIQRGPRMDLVERDAAEPGSVELADDRAFGEQRQCPVGWLDVNQPECVPAHPLIRTYVRLMFRPLPRLSARITFRPAGSCSAPPMTHALDDAG